MHQLKRFPLNIVWTSWLSLTVDKVAYGFEKIKYNKLLKKNFIANLAHKNSYNFL